jgi:hypothetical protein
MFSGQVFQDLPVNVHRDDLKVGILTQIDGHVFSHCPTAQDDYSTHMFLFLSLNTIVKSFKGQLSNPLLIFLRLVLTPGQVGPERTMVRYTGQEIPTMIAAYAAVSIWVNTWNRARAIQPRRQAYVLQG